jgi:hypothetical protein
MPRASRPRELLGVTRVDGATPSRSAWGQPEGLWLRPARSLVIAGSMAELLPDAPPRCSAAQVRAAVARSRQRGRVAIVIADHLKTHTPAGSLLVRRMLAELQEHLSIV